MNKYKMNCDDFYGGVVRNRGSTALTTIRSATGAGNECPHSHPYRIPGSNCCAEGRDLFYYKERQPALKRVSATSVTQLQDSTLKRSREEINDEDEEMNFGKPHKFKQFRAAYKRAHPKASEHRILIKYTAGLLRMRN
jgi:hypothetical protein